MWGVPMDHLNHNLNGRQRNLVDNTMRGVRHAQVGASTHGNVTTCSYVPPPHLKPIQQFQSENNESMRESPEHGHGATALLLPSTDSYQYRTQNNISQHKTHSTPQDPTFVASRGCRVQCRQTTKNTPVYIPPAVPKSSSKKRKGFVWSHHVDTCITYPSYRQKCRQSLVCLKPPTGPIYPLFHSLGQQPDPGRHRDEERTKNST
ncbi:hypothetical protein BDD12DRAFT_434591 [Trichophaea hybrida]|nr:hypothetical protein BDD12DRAFT_434591 [Trichophaea hybrida]